MDSQFSYKDYTVKLASAEDYSSIETLHEKVYRDKPQKNLYRTKYSHYNKALPNSITYIAVTNDDEVVATISLIPIALTFENKKIIVAQCADAMVHPQHQKQGLCSTVWKACLTKGKEIGLAGIFSIPIESTFYIATTKLGQRFVTFMYCYTIPIKTVQLASIARKLNLGKVYATYVSKLFSKYKSPIQPCLHSFNKENLVVERDEHFFLNKKGMGSFFIQIEKSALWLNFKNSTLFIGDIQAPNEDSMIFIINKLKAICFYAGIRSIVFQTTKGSNIELFLSKHYTAIPTYKICVAEFIEGLDMGNLQLTQGDADNF